MSEFTWETADEEGTIALGKALSAALPNGCVIGLIGDLGAGKTRLVQAIAEADGIDPREVVSPTFVLVHEYQGRRPIYHFDAYRLKDDDEFLALGAEEYFEGDGLTFVEWADRVSDSLPQERLEIAIDPLGPTARRFTIRGHGSPAERIVAALAAQFSAR